MSGNLMAGFGLFLYALIYVVPLIAIYTERTGLRAGRLDFLKWFVAIFAAALVPMVADRYLQDDILGFIGGVVAIVLYVPFSRSLVRRCRDAGLNKNWAYLSVLPFVGGVFPLVMLFWGPKQDAAEAPGTNS